MIASGSFFCSRMFRRQQSADHHAQGRCLVSNERILRAIVADSAQIVAPPPLTGALNGSDPKRSPRPWDWRVLRAAKGEPLTPMKSIPRSNGS